MRSLAMQWTSVRRAQSILILLLVLGAVPRAHADEKSMDAVAREFAGAIIHSKQHTLAVLDFSGPDKTVTALGQRVADDFSGEIAKAGGDLQVVERSRIADRRKDNYYPPAIVLDPPSVLVFAQELEADAVVVGSISLGQSDMLDVDLNAYRVDSGKGIKSVRVSFRLSEEMAALMKTKASTYALPPDLPSSHPGYSPPRCIYCPNADYTAEATSKRLEGHVELVVTVGEDGGVTDIGVISGLPGGLTAEAIAAIKKWRLAPATGPDGKPAAVRQQIDVDFAFH
jgi:TonB family protein